MLPSERSTETNVRPGHATETDMTNLSTIPATTSTAAAPTTVKPKSKRSRAQDALVRYAEEIASRLARNSRSQWRDDSRNDRGAIDSPLFADV